VTVALAAAVVLGVILQTGHLKLLVVVCGGLGCVALAYLSGNPRLFCLWGLALTLPLHLSKLFTPFSDRGGGENALRLEITDLFLAPLALALVRDVWVGIKPGLRVPKVVWPWALIMLMGIGAMLLGSWRRSAGFETIRMLKVLVLFLVVANELTSARRLLHAGLALATGMLVQAMIGVLQYIRGANLGLEKLGETSTKTIEVLAVKSMYNEEVWRVSALLLHPNVFAVFLAALLPLAIGLFLVYDHKGAKLLFLVAVALGMVSLIATYSRSGWVSFALSFVVMMGLMVANPTLRRRSTLAAAIATLALTGILMTFSGHILTRLFESQEMAETGRAEWRVEAWRLIVQRPLLGWGLNSYVDEAPTVSKWTRAAFSGWTPPVHHIYYLWWAETGLVGLALHLAIWGGLVWTAIGNLRVRDPAIYVLNAACLSGLLAFVPDGFFSFSLRINAILRLFWMLGAIVMAVKYWRLGHPVVTAIPERPLAASLTGAAVADRGLQ